MQLNRINQFYIIVAIALIGFHVYRVISYRAWDRYYYFTNICAPAAYPVYVRDAYFITGSGEISSIRNMEVNSFQTSWKEDYFFRKRMKRSYCPKNWCSNT
ncbi:hypothetical protein [Niabella hibiscisoli]|uniref:hypothetical protein n=1 Tax=Niabella hibiscisoli TaxID=1825928 RepID=UPI001F0E20EC|nr:hypothetical protein [Niabella hibiscisoli]MCH5719815.1 hypothetical protein [Niabella hibiscisoli]